MCIHSRAWNCVKTEFVAHSSKDGEMVSINCESVPINSTTSWSDSMPIA